GSPELKALAHITGGGLTDNLPRVLPDGLRAEIEVGSWDVPPLFELLAERGGVSRKEMFRVFNMGVGMVLTVASDSAESMLGRLRAGGEAAFVLGRVSAGDGGVVYLDPEGG
ncbi:MAG: AIR synthase-related protein, partial [Holophagales bacterium]|nr:AIR synthase-related protein [Holophagales bacterium]